jgi:cobalt-zinc-cadmium efflux system outer membrane protein
MKRITLLALGASLAASACASTKPTKVRTEVNDMLEERAGVADGVSAKQDDEARAKVRARVDQLVAEPLTMDGAVAVAVLNNQAMQAKLEDLGVAQAELVQAGLLDNPVVSGSIGFSTITPVYGVARDFSVSQSLLSVFLIPAKRRLAKAHLRHAVVEVGEATLELTRDVKVAYVSAQGALAGRNLQRQMVQVAEVADELAQRQIESGNVTELERELIASELDQARLDLLEAELHLTEAREQLNRLLGLWGKETGWKLAGGLAQVPAGEAQLDQLEQRGVRERLGLSAARFQVEAMEYALKLRRRGVIPQVDVGVDSGDEIGDDTGHEWIIGPSLSIEIPIFDPGHADFAALRAELRRSQYLLQEASIQARSEIRVSRETMLAAKRRAEYFRDVVVPRHETITEKSLEQYNGMLMGAYELFETRSHQFEVQSEHAKALRDYWIAKADLELAIGGRLPQPEG